ncbi:MAG TPA: CDP-alcohol phosphatidyltransferase family protein [Myxococcales bacterium]|jgi:cardiolipin synthase|nr:CDP-alcohol phosphatidyltransferase family protein [Myxococcales bacterium]
MDHELRHSHPMRQLPAAMLRARGQDAVLTLPNALSALRLLLIVPFLALYLGGHLLPAVVVFAIASGSDALDGLLARLLHQRSRLGAVLDPIADKLLGLAALVALVLHDRLPVWLLGVSVLRDGVVFAIALVSRLQHFELAAQPSRVGKYATFFTNTAVILALAWEISYAPVLAGYVFAVAMVAAECLVGAAAHYAWRFAAPPRLA